MKTYTVLFAQDVPHYGLVEITATGDKDALAKARRYWKRVQRNKEPLPLDEPDYDRAVLDRIVEITDETNRQVTADVRLDTYHLAIAPTELHVKLIENASPMYAALEKIARNAAIGLAGNELKKQVRLDEILSIARAVLAHATGSSE
jgi:hypothetical protein